MNHSVLLGVMRYYLVEVDDPDGTMPEQEIIDIAKDNLLHGNCEQNDSQIYHEDIRFAEIED